MYRRDGIKALGGKAAINSAAALQSLIKFVNGNRDAGRFTKDLVQELASFHERADNFLKESGIKTPFCGELFKLAVHDLTIDDKRVCGRLDVSMEEARRAMDVLCKQFPTLFSLEKDDEFGWTMIVEKEGMKYGIK